MLPEIQKAKIEMEGVASEIPTSLVLSQIILESGICGSSLSKKTKNLVGIKGGGKQGKEYARFRRPRDCIKYYLKTLSTHKAYEKLREHLDDSNALTLSRYLKRYAEDPQYTKKIANVIKTHDLMRFDV